MALDSLFTTLHAQFAALREALQSLRLTVIEDRPPRDEVLLVERLGNLVEDLLGWSEEGCAATTAACRAVMHPADLARARTALGTANLRFVQLEYGFVGDAVSHRLIDELLRLARSRGPEWVGWSKSVVQALDACRAPLRALDEAFVHTWQELCDRLGMASVSVTTTNIGQQFAPPAARRAAARTDANESQT